MTAGRSTTATILVTEVVESRGLRARVGGAVADGMVAQHRRRLGQLVARYGGRVLSIDNTNAAAAFESASDAVNAAIDLQRHVRHTTPELVTSVGAAAGDVTWTDDRCSGLPVVVAARLRAAAGHGQILISNVVRLLAGDRAAGSYERFGVLDVEGQPEPVDTYTVGWIADPADHVLADTAAPPPFPLALSVVAGHPLVGRDDALAALRSCWDDVRAGPGRLVMIGGEAGAGKTRLAAELAAELHASGACVLYGGCDAELALPYQPWVHAVDQLIAARLSENVDERASVLAPLANLLGTADRLPVESRRASLDAGAERYRTYRAFGSVLAEGSTRWPLLVVLDDLHWAGTQTLALLRHLARSGLPAGVLLVGTFRDTGDELTEPLASCLADLRRVDGVSRLRLAALDGAAVERFVADAVGQPLDDGLHLLAASLATGSGGNPFYLGELWRHLVEIGVVSFDGCRWTARESLVAGAVPDSVREVVADRVKRLAGPTRRFVELAALCGQRVDLQVLELAGQLAHDELDTAVGELVGAGVLVQASGSALVYRFAHALVSGTVVATIPPTARARLHHALAEAIEAVNQADRRPVLAELGAHYAAAGGPVDKVVYYGRRAAAQAVQAAAYDEAIAHLDNVLAANPPRLDRCGALIQRAATELRQGAYAASCTSSREAFAIAVELDDPAATADAAVGFEMARMVPGLPGGPSVDMLRTALASLGDEPSARRATVMASLGRALTFRGLASEGIATAEEALALARRLGGDEVIAHALHVVVTSTESVDRRLEAATELAELGGRTGDSWWSGFANATLLFCLFTLGRLDEAKSVQEHNRALSAAGHFATFEFNTYSFDMQFALAAGDLTASEKAAEHARQKGSTDESPYNAGVYGLQMYAIRRAQGRLAEVVPVMRAVSSAGDSAAMWRPGLAALYAELGMHDEAGTVFASLSADRFAAVARDAIWPASLFFLAETCAALADRDAATALYEELLAFRGRNLQAAFTICFGPADRLLGALASLLERPADADEHFQTALLLAERCDSPLWTAEAEYEWAVSLADRDPGRALQLSRHAVATAKAFGIGRLADRPVPVGCAAGTAPTQPAHPYNLSAREVEVLSLVATGLSNQCIGDTLFISQHTVANHVQAILRKTSCANRTEASLYAHRHGLIRDP
jgi:DNA-binding CsgD family transcriptional regulator/class 3 adenylate cyclase/tetratricopeptide (TPR) repeat protein